jgi:hypothetical protein
MESTSPEAMGPKPHGHHHDEHAPRPWQLNWKSPIGLGIFLLSASLSFAILLYAILSLIGAILQVTHPASASGITAQQLQQMQQSAGSGAGATQ